jgi:hypothetical protein
MSWWSQIWPHVLHLRTWPKTSSSRSRLCLPELGISFWSCTFVGFLHVHHVHVCMYFCMYEFTYAGQLIDDWIAPWIWVIIYIIVDACIYIGGLYRLFRRCCPICGWWYRQWIWVMIFGLCVCVCVCVYTYIYVYIYIYMYIHTNIYTYMYVCIYTCTYKTINLRHDIWVTHA